jgi:microsomal epoxide hydrolase
MENELLSWGQIFARAMWQFTPVWGALALTFAGLIIFKTRLGLLGKLMDSPVGTAAWILEKFNSWADVASKGSLEAVFTKDQLLTNIMIYLTTDSIASSVWYYRALFEEGGVALPEGVRCETPTGFANFPAEPVFVPPPRSWVERAYNIVRWTDMPRGGHFAAMEEPDLLIDDVRAFAREIAY